MRQIKFRGKRLDNREWVYGYYYEECGNTYIIEDRQHLRNSLIARNIPCSVNPNTVGQFTGLYDKDGREIYEGDIVSWLFFHGSLEVGKVEYKREEAQFRIVNRFTTMDNREITTTIQNKRNLIVRGNIYDNSELLKGGEK